MNTQEINELQRKIEKNLRGYKKGKIDIETATWGIMGLFEKELEKYIDVLVEPIEKALN